MQLPECLIRRRVGQELKCGERSIARNLACAFCDSYAKRSLAIEHSGATSICQTYFQRSLTAAESAEIGHRPIQANALHKARGLPQ